MEHARRRVFLLYLDLAGVLRGVERPYVNGAKEYSALFDASSVYGFEEIERSDLKLMLPANRLKSLPWSQEVSAGIASIHYTSGERYVKDPRLVAEKAEDFVESLGYIAYIGVEYEFFLFRGLNVEIGYTKQVLEISAPETSSSRYLLPPKRGYQVVEPVDEIRRVRRRIIEAIESIGYRVVKSHHEVASSGQVEVAITHREIVESCDAAVWVKLASKNVAEKEGFTAVFLPKPLVGDNGSGMHIHVSLWRGGVNLFVDTSDEYGVSQLARYFIGGLIEHGRSLSAIVSPTVNSYRRLILGYEAPTVLAWGVGNRSVSIRIPDIREERVFRIEYRPPDPMANPYLAIPAMVLAGIDGIKKKIEPPLPLNKNAYHYSEKELRELGYRRLPRSLDEALDELEADHEYLKPVYSRELLESYIEVKRREARELQAIPSPAEYYYYMYW